MSYLRVTRPKAAGERGIEPSQTPKFLSPFPPGRQAFVFGYCCPIPLTPWLAAPRVVAARKKEAFASLGVSTSFLLPYTEHPPQNGSDDSGGAQDDDLH